MARILWADDEIDSLKPHLIFLKNKGYEIEPVNSGNEAVEVFSSKPFDLVFLLFALLILTFSFASIILSLSPRPKLHVV